VPDARRPASPGQPRRERRDAVTQQEEFDELAAEQRVPVQPDATTDARHAERRAHTPRDRDPQRRR
jgi:hypothetical protein